MVTRFIQRISYLISDFINRPFRVLKVCLAFAFIGLIFDGTLFNLWALSRDSNHLENKTKMTLVESKTLKEKIKLANDPQFIELEAHERFELAGENELVFVFSDQE